jgi:hypothetical protein
MFLPSPFLFLYYLMRVSQQEERKMLTAFVKTLLSFSLEAAGRRLRKTPAKALDLLTQNPDRRKHLMTLSVRALGSGTVPLNVNTDNVCRMPTP